MSSFVESLKSCFSSSKAKSPDPTPKKVPPKKNVDPNNPYGNDDIEELLDDEGNPNNGNA